LEQLTFKKLFEERRMKVKTISAVLLAVLLLGAKCATDSKAVVSEAEEINAQESVIDIIPELKEHSKDFDITKYDDYIRLITHEELTFQKAVHILKTKTEMNKSVYIYLKADDKLLIEKGELKSECAADWVVWYTGMELRPYTGIIYILDGYWTAIELNAFELFKEEGGDNEKVSVTEYFYTNEAVYTINGFSFERGVLSRLDEGEEGEKVKGDGSMDHEIVTEFDK